MTKKKKSLSTIDADPNGKLKRGAICFFGRAGSHRVFFCWLFLIAFHNNRKMFVISQETYSYISRLNCSYILHHVCVFLLLNCALCPDRLADRQEKTQIYIYRRALDTKAHTSITNPAHNRLNSCQDENQPITFQKSAWSKVVFFFLDGGVGDWEAASDLSSEMVLILEIASVASVM